MIPADNKWFTHLMVGAAVTEAMKELALSYPKPDPSKRSALRSAQRELLAEERRKRKR